MAQDRSTNIISMSKRIPTSRLSIHNSLSPTRARLHAPGVSPPKSRCCLSLVTAVERIWHIYDSQSQILALALGGTPLKPMKLFPLRSEASLFMICTGASRGRAKPFKSVSDVYSPPWEHYRPRCMSPHRVLYTPIVPRPCTTTDSLGFHGSLHIPSQGTNVLSRLQPLYLYQGSKVLCLLEP